KFDSFISFVIVSLLVAIAEGMTISEAVISIEKGIGNTMGFIIMILSLGAMLGKLVSESGAAQRITEKLVQAFGTKHIQWALMLTGFIVGISLFYDVAFFIMIPLVFTVAASTRLPLLYVGLPMLAALSVTHGYLPPHPAPTAITAMFQADFGKTMIYGIIVAIPAIIISGPILSRALSRIDAKPLKEFISSKPLKDEEMPGFWISFFSALLPVLLIGISTIIGFFLTDGSEAKKVVGYIGNPVIAMLASVLFATYTLGLARGRKIGDIMKSLTHSVVSLTVIMLLIAGAGALKQVLVDSGVSNYIAAGIVLPLISATGVSPELMVLAIGSGSLMLGHVNDGGFWLFKEYFNLSIKDTLRSWTIMETSIGISGLIGVMILSIIVK
ncbi:MAG: gluconate:H+ symporter, partial [Bacteroidia bacterium]|nr:gluconate:H+ symporter [Bacteroidia bacterium]